MASQINVSFPKRLVRKKNVFFRRIKIKFLFFRYKIRKNNDVINYNNIKKVLLLRLDDKIGDMVVASGVIKLLAEKKIDVYLLTGPCCANMLAHSEYLKKVFIYHNRGSLKYLAQEKFDAVIDFDDVVTYERCRLVHKIAAKCSIGFNKNRVPVYTQSIDFYDENKHISGRHSKVLAFFGINEYDYNYHIPISPDSVTRVDKLLSSLNYRRLIAINPLTGSDDKDFTRDQVQGLIDHIAKKYPDDQVILIGIDSKLISLNVSNAVFVDGSTVNTAAEIIRRADFVVSPDTSIVHMCKAFNKPLLAIYNKRRLKDTGLIGYKIWAPNYPGAYQMVVDQDDISQLPTQVIKDEFDRLVIRNK
ncbi:glycosyltransferase family 9 protein [Erwinia aphidicola]|uniref:glycosyltransferase family 9 protein n=1 Tax=Erwinia aphidicola TaxID=68334 RepID=UPI003017BDF4